MPRHACSMKPLAVELASTVRTTLSATTVKCAPQISSPILLYRQQMLTSVFVSKNLNNTIHRVIPSLDFTLSGKMPCLLINFTGLRITRVQFGHLGASVTHTLVGSVCGPVYVHEWAYNNNLMLAARECGGACTVTSR